MSPDLPRSFVCLGSFPCGSSVTSSIRTLQHVLYRHMLHVECDVVCSHHFCLCDVHLPTNLPSSIG